MWDLRPPDFSSCTILLDPFSCRLHPRIFIWRQRPTSPLPTENPAPTPPPTFLLFLLFLLPILFFGCYYHSSTVAAVFNTIYTTRVRNLIKFSTHHRAIAS
jgi:hypothetical protein